MYNLIEWCKGFYETYGYEYQIVLLKLKLHTNGQYPATINVFGKI